MARNELLGSASATGIGGAASGATMRRGAGLGVPERYTESPFGGSSSYQPNQPNSREDFALREHSFLRESENHIDQYIAQGRAVLENLVEQRGMLKGAKTRLLNAANTLGLSRETIAWVERRTWVVPLGSC